jgi:RecA/RadA recombinase
MAINLKGIQPHKVSRDLSGYITYIYGAEKSGKTTFASQMPAPLILAFEKGYNALPGVMAQDVTTWGEMKQVLRQLKDEDVKSMFKSVIIDTIDIAGGLCERYVCSQAGVDAIGDIPYGQGWTRVKKEFEDTCRAITQLGYALVFISHSKDKTFKAKNGIEYNQIVPTCPTSFNNIAKDMADLYMYAEKYTGENGEGKVRLVMRSPDNSAETGCRFKYIKPIIEDFNYDNVVQALNEAIDKEAALNGGKYITDARESIVTKAEYDYDALMNEFQELVGALMNKNPSYYSPRITQIVDKYLGKGRKISDATIDQAELVSLVVTEIKDELLATEK